MAKRSGSKSTNKRKSKTAKVRAKVKPNRKITRKSTAKTRKSSPVRIAPDTYNQWIASQVRSKKSRSTPAMSINIQSVMPKDTFNEWITKQHVVEKTSIRKDEGIFSDTYEEWIRRQIAERSNRRDEDKGGEIVQTSSGLLQRMDSPSKIMPASATQPLVNPDFGPLLSKSDEIELTFTGRKSGKSFSTPVWFVYDQDEQVLSLLPVGGSESNWFKNLQAKSSLRLSIGGTSKTFEGAEVAVDPSKAEAIAEKFRAKYGTEDVKRYYSKFDGYVLLKVN